MELDDFLINKGYGKIDLKKNEIGHYQFQVTLNNVDGNFILDTGASSSCVGIEFADKYNLYPKSSDFKAAGAGAIDMDTFQSEINSMYLGSIKIDLDSIILFDLTQINEALEQHDSDLIDGIIGADILEQLSAVISYGEKAVYILGTTTDVVEI